MIHKNKENIVKQKDKRVVDKLTKEEHRALRTLIKGYGRLEHASLSSGVHRKTLERIAIRGSGLKENTEKIRVNLLTNSVKIL